MCLIVFIDFLSLIKIYLKDQSERKKVAIFVVIRKVHKVDDLKFVYYNENMYLNVSTIIFNLHQLKVVY
jgi:hypothetical protein